MDRHELLTEYRRESREVVWEGETLEAMSGVTRRSSYDGRLNWVTAFELEDDTADLAIQMEVDHFRRLGRAFEWKAFSFDRPANLLDRLRDAGFTVGDKEAIMIYDLKNGLPPFDNHGTCLVKRVANAQLLADFRAVAERVFNKDYSLTVNQLADALEEKRRGHDAYVGYIGGEPVSVGRLYTDSKSQFAGLYGGGTLSEFRSKGCYRAVTAARAGDAAVSGARYLQVDALPTSLPILQRLGFVQIAETWACNLPE